jgi:acyl-CoA thioesterase-1
MYAPRNMGADYVERFESIYRDVARKHGLVLYPFFLEGVAGDRGLNLPDGVHPTARGVEVIVERILPSVETFLAHIQQR